MTTVSVSNDLVVANSSASTASSTAAAITRWGALPSLITADPTLVTVTNSSTPVNDITLAQTTQVSSSSVAPTVNLGVTQPIGYKFNLPPHNWSLPLRPVTVDPDLVGKTNGASFHGLRRGRIWYWSGANNISTTSTTSSSTSNSSTSNSSAPLNLIDNNWGFQFLWNPTTISTSVSRNMDITPSSADSLRVVAGVYPGQETVNLDISIDRTNDFACIKAAAAADFGTYSRYYTALYPGASTSQSMSEQITYLMSQGTMADLEYLFKAINGSGNGSLEWTNLLGKKTANVGYLAPTLLGIQLGPTLDNLCYVGWISNISINHTAFTENMIPIRTEVGISIQCFSGSGLTSGV